MDDNGCGTPSIEFPVDADALLQESGEPEPAPRDDGPAGRRVWQLWAGAAVAALVLAGGGFAVGRASAAAAPTPSASYASTQPAPTGPSADARATQDGATSGTEDGADPGTGAGPVLPLAPAGGSVCSDATATSLMYETVLKPRPGHPAFCEWWYTNTGSDALTFVNSADAAGAQWGQTYVVEHAGGPFESVGENFLECPADRLSIAGGQVVVAPGASFAIVLVADGDEGGEAAGGTFGVESVSLDVEAAQGSFSADVPLPLPLEVLQP